MLDHEDLKWIATTSTDLNAMLQQIARYSDLARHHKGQYNYIDLLGERVELASKSAQALFDRVTSKILAETPAQPEGPLDYPAFSVVSSRVSVPASPIAAQTPPSVAGPADRPPPMPTDFAPVTTDNNGTGPMPPEISILNSSGPKELILLVEDEAEIARLASDMLADEGYKVILARDGFEALKIYQQIGTRIGLVILDFFLPVMDGDAIFDELRTLNPQVAVVLSSGFAEQNKIGAMLSQGLRGFIPKPYTREKLLEQVRSTLDAARQGTR